MKKPKKSLMPCRLANGNDALRMLDHLKCTPKEASLLFTAAQQFGVDNEGREIFCMLEEHFEALLILHGRNELDADEWKNVVHTAISEIDALMTLLAKRLPANTFAHPPANVAFLKEWADKRLPHGLTEYQQAG